MNAKPLNLDIYNGYKDITGLPPVPYSEAIGNTLFISLYIYIFDNIIGKPRVCEPSAYKSQFIRFIRPIAARPDADWPQCGHSGTNLRRNCHGNSAIPAFTGLYRNFVRHTVRHKIERAVV